MANKKLRYYSAREFLNKDKTLQASILSNIESDTSERYIYTDNTLSISDCHRTINLDVSFDDLEEYMEITDKLKLIEDIIGLTLKALSLQQMDMTQYQKKLKKSDKKSDKK